MTTQKDNDNTDVSNMSIQSQIAKLVEEGYSIEEAKIALSLSTEKDNDIIKYGSKLLDISDLHPTTNEFLNTKFSSDEYDDFVKEFNTIYYDIFGLKRKAFDSNTFIDETMLCLIRLSELQKCNLNIRIPIILYLQDKQQYNNALNHSIFALQNCNFNDQDLLNVDNQTQLRILYEYHSENLFHLKKYLSVINIFNEWILKYSNKITSSRMYHMSFFAHTKLHNYQNALKYITKSIELDPMNATLYNHRCYVYCELKCFDKALMDANNCLKIDNKHQIGLNNRGSVYNDLKKWNLAIIDLDLSIKISKGKNANAFKHRSWSYFNLGEYNKAISDINKAIQMNNNYMEAKKLLKTIWKYHVDSIQKGVKKFCGSKNILFWLPLVHLIADYTVGDQYIQLTHTDKK